MDADLKIQGEKKYTDCFSCMFTTVGPSGVVLIVVVVSSELGVVEVFPGKVTVTVKLGNVGSTSDSVILGKSREASHLPTSALLKLIGLSSTANLCT